VVDVEEIMRERNVEERSNSSPYQPGVLVFCTRLGVGDTGWKKIL
jgi:hypothetical protein